MSYDAKVICDSISETGIRLTTLEVTIPRMMLSEFNTHRMLSRNSASSRAIPVAKQLERIRTDPFVPAQWGSNKSGMQAGDQLEGNARIEAEAAWRAACDNAIGSVEKLVDLGLHKQTTNRLIEPFMWHTILVTATEWSNFFALRDHANAQPEIQVAAALMKKAMAESTPRLLQEGEWHLPLIQPDELEWARENLELAIKVSAGRCARVSYLTHDGVRDHDKDIKLCEDLMQNGHMSPLEHVARPFTAIEYEVRRSLRGNIFDWLERGSISESEAIKLSAPLSFDGNFCGWTQFRKTIPGEHDFSLVAA